MGWMVRQTEDDEKILEKLKEMAEKDSFDGIDLRVNRVPEHLAKLKHIKRLTLTFTDKVVLPEWMDKIKIDEFRVNGKLSDDEVEALFKRFPKIIINNISKRLILIKDKKIDMSEFEGLEQTP